MAVLQVASSTLSFRCCLEKGTEVLLRPTLLKAAFIEGHRKSNVGVFASCRLLIFTIPSTCPSTLYPCSCYTRTWSTRFNRTFRLSFTHISTFVSWSSMSFSRSVRSDFLSEFVYFFRVSKEGTGHSLGFQKMFILSYFTEKALLKASSRVAFVRLCVATFETGQGVTSPEGVT